MILLAHLKVWWHILNFAGAVFEVKVLLPLASNWDNHFFKIFFTHRRGRPQSKQELTFGHSQRPIACCGPNQGKPNISLSSRILPGLLHDTLLLPI
jgi:hypothetical protein